MSPDSVSPQLAQVWVAEDEHSELRSISHVNRLGGDDQRICGVNYSVGGDKQQRATPCVTVAVSRKRQTYLGRSSRSKCVYAPNVCRDIAHRLHLATCAACRLRGLPRAGLIGFC